MKHFSKTNLMNIKIWTGYLKNWQGRHWFILIIGLFVILVSVFFILHRFAKKEDLSQDSVLNQKNQFESLLSNIKKTRSSPEFNLLESQNMNLIKEKSQKTTKMDERSSFIQAGILFSDTGGFEKWTQQNIEILEEELAWLILEKPQGKYFSKQRSLAFHLFKRLIKIQLSEKVLQSFEMALIKEKDDYEKSTLIELLSHGTRISDKVLHEIKRCLLSKNKELSLNSLLSIDQVKKTETKLHLINFILENQKKIPSENLPHLYKLFFTNSGLFSKDYSKKLLDVVSKQSSEIWDDVFLFGVIELNLKNEYIKKIKEMAQDSSYPLLKRKASIILESGGK